jgi:ABC-type dipeptide/oligopeptide/nickel transport system permease component
VPVVGRSVAKALVVLFAVSIIVFASLRLAPGDPALLLLGSQANRADNAQRLADLRTEMGLDDAALADVARASIRGSGAPDDLKASTLRLIDDWLAAS